MGWVRRVLAWLVILGIGTIVTISVLIPRIGGATPYVVLTGSMRPTMPPGTMVVARPVKAQQLGIGDVVTYQLKSGEPAVVTHRIVGMASFQGKPIFQTRGDANNVADEKWVRPVQIKGARWYAVPYLGYVTSAISGQQRHVALIAIVTVLFGYAAYMFLSAALDRSRQKRHPVPATKGESP
ncbi:MAG: signal peptidase I [Aeromicrobium sp.]